MAPEFADRVEHLQDWHQTSLLSVEAGRFKQWFRPGLLLIGDAAHVMSPVGGVGINYAIQDAVVAANVLTRAAQAGPAAPARPGGRPAPARDPDSDHSALSARRPESDRHPGAQVWRGGAAPLSPRRSCSSRSCVTWSLGCWRSGSGRSTSNREILACSAAPARTGGHCGRSGEVRRWIL